MCLYNWLFFKDECIKLLKTVEIKSHGVASIRVRSDGKIAAAGCWDGK